MLSGINLVIFHVSNIEATLPFYTEKLGLTIASQAPTFVQFGGNGGAGLALSQEQPLPGGGVEAWWFVADVDALHDSYAARGVAITSPLTDMPFGRTFSASDPDGNKLYLLQLPG
jgi:predicted enzyme related to lactoylglutathione lyase